MPLLDHFHPPLSERRHWQGFHSRWASSIADALNAEELGENLFAEPTIDLGSVEVDVATLDEGAFPATNGTHAVGAGPIGTVQHIVAPTWVVPAIFPDTFEVRVIKNDGGPKLVAAIELVSPANKDRPQTRRAFAIKCASYLTQGIHLIIVDVVTNRLANLHNEILELMQRADFHFPASTKLYAAAYRPVRRETREEIDVWPATFDIGDDLPRLPLYVGPDLAVTVDFEAAYQETCRKLRVM
jgi:hypothetical protein